MRAKAGEIWVNPNGVRYLVTGEDTIAQQVCVGGGWLPADLEAEGWTRISVGPEALQTGQVDLTARVVALEGV